MMPPPVLSPVSQSWCSVIVKQPLCAILQPHQGDHDRCVIPLLNHNWAAANNQESGSCGILWSEREVILSTFDKSDHHPLAVSLVGTLWEGGRVALSTSFRLKWVHRKENTDSLTSRWSNLGLWWPPIHATTTLLLFAYPRPQTTLLRTQMTGDQMSTPHEEQQTSKPLLWTNTKLPGRRTE